MPGDSPFGRSHHKSGHMFGFDFFQSLFSISGG
jgi:hypothetical protein